MLSSDTLLRVAGFEEDCIADGPGLRCVLFTQGCPHHCPGCQNPQTWDFDGGTVERLDALYERICANPITTGITFSGGEPFAQPEALSELAEALKPDYDLAAYTGYTWEGLMSLSERRPAVLRFLRTLDILIDGPFVQARADRLLLFRGSGNQRILDVPESLRLGTPAWTKDPAWIGSLGNARVEG